MSRNYTGAGSDRILYSGPTLYPYTHRNTFATWVMRTSDPTTLLRFFQESGVNQRLIMGANNNSNQGPFPGYRLFRYDAAGNYQRSWVAPFTVGIGVWSHFAYTQDTTSTSTAPVIYINGAAVALNAYDSSNNAVATDPIQVRLGNNTAGTSGWPGALQNSAYWNDILSPEEIMALAKGVSPHLIRTGKLAWHYPQYQTAQEGDWASGRVGELFGTTVAPAPVPSGPMLIV